VEVPGNGLFRAYSHTGRIGALLAREGNEEIVVSSTTAHDLYPFPRNAPVSGVPRGTGRLAFFAAVAFKWIYEKNFRRQG
jgi:hypothetical protein